CDGTMAFGKARAALEYYLRVGSRDGLQGKVDEVILDDERFCEVEAICRPCNEFAPVFLVFMQVHRSPRFQGFSRLFCLDSASRILSAFACPFSKRTF